MKRYMVCTIQAFFIVSFFIASQFTFAATKVIDKRNRSELGEYEVHFCFRPSPSFFGQPGHSFVGFWKKDDNSNKVKFRAFGSTAASVAGIFGGDGYLLPEYASNIKEDCLIVQLNSDKYSLAWELATPLFAEPEYYYWNYNILGDSCVDYARNIAQSIGLVTNNKALPKSFIQKLKSDN